MSLSNSCLWVGCMFSCSLLLACLLIVCLIVYSWCSCLREFVVLCSISTPLGVCDNYKGTFWAPFTEDVWKTYTPLPLCYVPGSPDGRTPRYLQCESGLPGLGAPCGWVSRLTPHGRVCRRACAGSPYGYCAPWAQLERGPAGMPHHAVVTGGEWPLYPFSILLMQVTEIS